MDLDLRGKRALVGGASAGIGRAIALELAQLGASVVGLARTEEKLKDLMSHLNQFTKKGEGQNHSYLVIDISQREKLLNLVEGEIHRGGPFHILINNTGGPPAGPVLGASPAAFQSAFENHLLVNSQLSQLLIPAMKEQGFGRIINILSTSVKTPLPHLGVSNSIRWAVASWAKTLSGEVASFGITVNNVLPGATETDRLKNLVKDKAAKAGITPSQEEQNWKDTIPAGRFGRPEEVAAVAAFLCTPAAAYVNGVAIAVDGGRTVSL